MTPRFDPSASFSQSYREARERILHAASSRGLAVASHVHPHAKGADGEDLAIDVARLGRRDAPFVLVLTSAMHGVEGFCGSGCQLALLQDEAFVGAVDRAGVELLFVHAVNPYGFSYLRRVNEDNVDLNRNFRDFSVPPAPNADYAEVHGFMLPASWPPPAENEARMLDYMHRRGPKALQQAVSAGQSDHPDGLFFAGVRPTWSNVTLREIFGTLCADRQRMAWIDFHTALGAWGHGEKIFSGPNDPAMLARAHAIFGADITSFYDGSSTSAALTGVSFHAAIEECPDVQYTGIALEYGTMPIEAVLQALRAEQWLTNHPDAGAPQRAAIKRAFRDAFYVDDDAWKGMVFGQARVACLQVLTKWSR